VIHMKSRLASPLANLFRRSRVEQDVDDEVHAFVEVAADERRRAGVPDREARRAALVELGRVEQIRESVRDARPARLSISCARSDGRIPNH